MTAPRDPGGADRPDVSPDREVRRGRHWAPDDDDVVTIGAASGPADGERPAAGRGAGLSDSHEAPAARDQDGAGVAATAARSGPRHAASDSGYRLQPWMVGVAAVIVVALVAWLVIGLIFGGEAADDAAPSASPTVTETSAEPTPVDPMSLPPVLCIGQSYAMLDTGQPVEQLLADPAAVESQYPGSQLATIPPGCVAGSDQRDQVVLALGPFPTLNEACAAGLAAGVPFTAYQGSADTGLVLATCPPA